MITGWVHLIVELRSPDDPTKAIVDAIDKTIPKITELIINELPEGIEMIDVRVDEVEWDWE